MTLKFLERILKEKNESKIPKTEKECVAHVCICEYEFSVTLQQIKTKTLKFENLWPDVIYIHFRSAERKTIRIFED